MPRAGHNAVVNGGTFGHVHHSALPSAKNKRILSLPTSWPQGNAREPVGFVTAAAVARARGVRSFYNPSITRTAVQRHAYTAYLRTQSASHGHDQADAKDAMAAQQALESYATAAPGSVAPEQDTVTPPPPPPPAQVVTTVAPMAAVAATSYTLVSPNWQPLAGVSKQHAKVEKEVS